MEVRLGTKDVIKMQMVSPGCVLMKGFQKEGKLSFEAVENCFDYQGAETKRRQEGLAGLLVFNSLRRLDV